MDLIFLIILASKTEAALPRAALARRLCRVTAIRAKKRTARVVRPQLGSLKKTRNPTHGGTAYLQPFAKMT